MQLEKDFLVEGFDRATHRRCSTCLHHMTVKWVLDSIFTRMFDLIMLLIKSSTMSVLLRNSSKTRTQFLVASLVLFDLRGPMGNHSINVSVSAVTDQGRRNAATSLYKQNTAMNVRVSLRMRVRCCYCPTTY